jgi:D-glycero-D-manno-heptose 1,7-bisphosphate phosphatase
VRAFSGRSGNNAGEGGGEVTRKAIFLDRDGVINVRLPDGAYVTRWEEFTFCEGAPEAMRLLQRSGYLLVVVTNQRGIGRGLMTEDDLADIHRRMREELEREGVTLDAVLHCPHDHDAKCRCRKPLPGMIEEGVSRFSVNRDSSLIIGDSLSDIEAGRAAGIDGILVVPPGEQASEGLRTAPSLLDAALAVTGETR